VWCGVPAFDYVEAVRVQIEVILVYSTGFLIKFISCQSGKMQNALQLS
jgi:hypothetical protein